MLIILRALESPVIEALGWALVHFVWQAALLAGLLAALLVSLRRASAQLRYLIQCAMLVAMVACPLATWWWIASSQKANDLAAVSRDDRAVVNEGPLLKDEPVVGPMVASQFETDEPIFVAPAQVMSNIASRPDRIETPQQERAILWNERVRRGIAPALPWLVGTWLLGVVVLSLRLLVGWRIVQRLKRFAVKPAAEAWQLRLKDLATRLGISRTVRLVESALIEVPTVIGCLRPMILLPVSLLTNLTPQQLEAVLAHELAHIRRHDYLVNLLQTAIETLLFYHPAVWWLSRLIRSEREHCCDDLALSLCDSPVTYVSALAVMEELRASPALTMAASGGSLLNRIRRIALGPVSDSRRSIWWGASLIALTALVALGLTTYITSHASDDSTPKAEQNTAILSTEPPAALKGDDGNAPLLKNAALLPNGAKMAQLEFRIAANLPEDGWEPVLPKDWEQRTYRDVRLPAGKDHEAGFVWYPLNQPWRSDAAFVVSKSTPGTIAEGNELLHLLSDKPEHGMLMDGSWSVLDAKVVQGKRNPAPGEELGYAINVRLDDAGQKRFAELVSSYRDMSLAVVMHGEIVGKLLLKKPSARLEFGGHFTKEWAEELARQLNGMPPDPLATPVSFYANFVTLQTVFDKVLPAIVERAGRKLSLDTDSFKAAGVEFNRIVTLKAADESLRRALDKILGASHIKLDYRLSEDGKDLIVFAPSGDAAASSSQTQRESTQPSSKTGVTEGDKERSATAVGTVVAPDNKPVAGIEVLAFQGGKQLEQKFTTDAKGEFRVPKAWREVDHWLTVVARDGRERLGWFDFMIHGHSDIGQKSEDGSFRLVLLPMNQTVRGRVLDESGQPLAQIPVQINQLDHEVNSTSVHWRYQKLGDEALVLGAITDNDGRFELKLPANTFAWLGTSHPDWVEQRIRATKEKDDVGDIKLVRAAKVAGRVIDSRTGTPLAGVTIAAHAARTEILESGGDEAKTDAEGNYLIQGLRSGEYTIQLEKGADKTLTAPAVAKALLKSGQTFQADFSLSVGKRLAGRVLDMDTGEPIPSCKVTYTGPARPGNGLSAETNKRGEFEFFVPPGPSTLDATEGRRFGNDSTRKVDVPADGDPEPIVLKVGEETESIPGSFKIFIGPPLDRKVSLHFQRAPLVEVLERACQAAGMKLELDGDGLKSVGYTKNMSVTIDSDNVTLRDALTQVLKPYEKLSFTADKNQIFVSTRPQVEAREKQATEPKPPVVNGVDDSTVPATAGLPGVEDKQEPNRPLSKQAELDLFSQRLRAIAPKDWTVERCARAFRLLGPEVSEGKSRASILLWFEDVSISSSDLSRRDPKLPEIGVLDNTRIGRCYFVRNEASLQWHSFVLDVRKIQPVDHIAKAGIIDSEVTDVLWFDAAFVRDVEVGKDGRRSPILSRVSAPDYGITALTKFLVVGELPDPEKAKTDEDKQTALRHLASLKELQEEARQHGVRTISVAEFEAYTQKVLKDGRGHPTRWVKDPNQIQPPQCLTTGDGLTAVPMAVQAEDLASRIRRGQDALERVKQRNPVWGEKQDGLQVGLARLGDKSRFRPGERVPLEIYIRNVGQQSVVARFTAEFYSNVPTVRDPHGKDVTIEPVILLGARVRYKEILKPGEMVVYPHWGLGIGTTRPADYTTIWAPFVAAPIAGTYTVAQSLDLTITPEGSDDSQVAKLSSGLVKFEVEADHAGWGKELNGLRTRVTSLTEKPAVGQPLRVKIELQNIGKVERTYQSQRADPDYLLDVVGPDGKPAEFIKGGSGIPVQSLKIKPDETVVLWEDVDVASMFLLANPGRYEIKLRGPDRFDVDAAGPERAHPNPASNTLAVTLAEGTLNDIQATFVRIRNIAPKDWNISTRGNSISNIQKSITRRGEFHLLFTKERQSDGQKLGGTLPYEYLGQTRLGHAYLAVNPLAKTEWPECVEKIREQLPPTDTATGEWGRELNGLRTRVTLLTEEPAVGQPLKVKIELQNVGQVERKYQSQRANPDYLLEVVGPDGKPAEFINGPTQVQVSSANIEPDETIVLWESIDVASMFLLPKSGRYEIKLRGPDRGDGGEADPERVRLYPTSNTLPVTVVEGMLNDIQATFVGVRNIAPKGWQVSTRDNSILLISPNFKKGGVGRGVIHLAFVKEQKTDEQKLLGTIQYEHLGLTTLGHAYVAASPETRTEWLECIEQIRELLPSKPQ